MNKNCEIERYTSHSYTVSDDDDISNLKRDEIIYCWKYARHSVVTKSFTTDSSAHSHVIGRRGIYKVCTHRKEVYRLCDEHFNLLYEQREEPEHIDTQNIIDNRRKQTGISVRTSRFRFRRNRL
jgi:hypothetical protein